jgi:hypothetical protein
MHTHVFVALSVFLMAMPRVGDAADFALRDGASVLEPGDFRVLIGGCSPGPRGPALGASQPAQATFTVL